MSISRISFCGDSKNTINYLDGYNTGKSIRCADEMKEFLVKSMFVKTDKAYRDGFEAATGVKLPKESILDRMMYKALKLGISYRSSETAEAHQTAAKVMGKIADLVAVKPFKLK